MYAAGDNDKKNSTSVFCDFLFLQSFESKPQISQMSQLKMSHNFSKFFEIFGNFWKIFDSPRSREGTKLFKINNLHFFSHRFHRIISHKKAQKAQK